MTNNDGKDIKITIKANVNVPHSVSPFDMQRMIKSCLKHSYGFLHWGKINVDVDDKEYLTEFREKFFNDKL